MKCSPLVLVFVLLTQSPSLSGFVNHYAIFNCIETSFPNYQFICKRPHYAQSNERRPYLFKHFPTMSQDEANTASIQGSEPSFKFSTPGVVRKQDRSSPQDRRLLLRSKSRVSVAPGDSAPRLASLRVVLLSTKRPVTIGMVARACACFEVRPFAVSPHRVG
jgi:hypothetical protein